MRLIRKILKTAISTSEDTLKRIADFLEDPSQPDQKKQSGSNVCPGLAPNVGRDLSQEESERRKALLDDIPVGLYRTTKDGQILEANLTMVEMLGYPDRESFLNTMAGDCYLDSAEREKCNEIVARKGVVNNFETRFRRWDDSVIWVRDSCAEVRDEKGNLLYYQGSVQDITETVLARQALMESEERYRNLIERQGDGLGIVDQNETFTFTNPIADEIFGVEPGNLLGRNLREFMAPETFEAIKEQTARRRKGARSTYEVEIIRATGEIRSLVCTATPWTDKEGNYTGSFAIFHDNTEHRETLLSLKHSEEKYKAVMNQSAECIFLLDPQDMSVIEANASLRRLLGYRKEEMAEISVHDFVDHPREDIEKNIGKVQDSRSYFLGERKYRRKDGRIVYVEVNASMISYSGKNVLCVVSRDITERKQAAEALKESEERLRRSLRLDAIGRLAGGVAHDFNNLMAGIIGCAELLLKRTEESNPLRKHIQEIHGSAERAANLTQQLLSFSRSQDMEAQKTDFNEIVVDMSDLMKRMLGEQKRLFIDPADEPCMIKADRSQMEQIILNLVHNAGDAIDDGGNVYVKTRHISIGEKEGVEYPNCDSGEYVEFTVRDDGHGMTENVKEQVFDPFFTTKEQGKGTGLGLSTVYGIVKNHQGWINVESSPGKGAAFTILFPAYKRMSGFSQQEMGVPGGGQNESLATGLKVLLVDQDEDGRSRAVEILANLGCEVESASSATEAFKLAERFSAAKTGSATDKTWELVVANLTLPDESGIRLADELRTRFSTLPILLYGTFAKSMARLTSIGEKGYGYIQRPFEEEDLYEGMKKVLATNAEKKPFSERHSSFSQFRDQLSEERRVHEPTPSPNGPHVQGLPPDFRPLRK